MTDEIYEEMRLRIEEWKRALEEDVPAMQIMGNTERLWKARARRLRPSGEGEMSDLREAAARCVELERALHFGEAESGAQVVTDLQELPAHWQAYLKERIAIHKHMTDIMQARIEELERVLRCCVQAMEDHNHYGELKRDCAWHFGDEALPQARAVLEGGHEPTETIKQGAKLLDDLRSAKTKQGKWICRSCGNDVYYERHKPDCQWVVLR